MRRTGLSGYDNIADIQVLVQVASVAGNRIAQIILLLGATALPLGGVYLWYAGSAVVIDETGHVESAVVTDGRSEQPLRHLWNGYFFAIPETGVDALSTWIATGAQTPACP